MGKITATEWDPAEMIQTGEDAMVFFEGAFEENDPGFLSDTIGYIARSKGMARLARETGLDREESYRYFEGKEDPPFGAVVQVLDRLGFRIDIKRKEESPAASRPLAAELVPV